MTYACPMKPRSRQLQHQVSNSYVMVHWHCEAKKALVHVWWCVNAWLLRLRVSVALSQRDECIPEHYWLAVYRVHYLIYLPQPADLHSIPMMYVASFLATDQCNLVIVVVSCYTGWPIKLYTFIKHYTDRHNLKRELNSIFSLPFNYTTLYIFVPAAMGAL